MFSSSRDYNIPSPRASGVISRQRLLDQLVVIPEHKLTLICAPPGYGKTTLVAQFAEQSQLPFAWQTIEERERDLPNLYAHALSALEQVAPGMKALGTLSGYTARELAAVITNALRERVDGHFLYIIDDVQLLTGSMAAETWLQTLVSLLPPNCHLVLLSRALPDLPLTEMIARREVLAIGQDQLRFSSDETVQLASKFGVTPSAQRIHELNEGLEGWPAGTVLAFQPLPSELEQMLLRGGQGPEALFDALAIGMLRAQPPGLRNFLLESSTLTYITPERCAALGIQNAMDWLAEALNRHLFMSQVPGGVVYHRLFRSFLQGQLARDDPDRFAQLHLLAAECYERENQIDEAIEHYLTGGLTDRAMPLVEHVSPAYFTQGKTETLLGWRNRLSQFNILAPKLFLTSSKIFTDRYEYAEAETDLNRAEAGFARTEDDVGMAEVRLQQARASLQQGNYTAAVQQSLEYWDLFNIQERLLGRALRTLGFAQIRLGEVEPGITHLEEAVPLYRDDGDANALSQVLQDLVVAYAQLGRNTDLSACLQEVVALRRALGSPGALALALNNLGHLYHRCNDYELALQTLEEGLSVISQVSNKRAEGHLLWSLADVKRDLSNFDEALRLYNKALELIGSSEPPIRCAILIGTATLYRWEKKWHEAVALGEEALALAQSHGLVLEESLARASAWSARAQLGEAPRALDYLEDTVRDLSRQGALYEQLQVLASSVQVSLLCKDRVTADDHYRSALQIGGEMDTMQPFIAELAHTPQLEEFVNTQTQGKKAIQKDVLRLRDAENISGSVIRTQNLTAQPTYSVRVWTLGQERIERDGKPVSTSDWRATASRELFLYLLFIGPATREQISLVFWPDSSSQQVRNNFHSTVYRTRQALGENVIALEDGIYSINPDLAMWCDIFEFEEAVRGAQVLSSRDARTEDLWQRAINLYKGDFLESVVYDWAASRRASSQDAFIAALIGAANCARQRDGFQDALNYLRRALKVDPYREDVYRTIMHCYADLGERKQILATLDQLQHLLRRELAIEPSHETLQLAEALLH